MSEAQKMWDAAIAAAKELREDPIYKAYIHSLVARDNAERKRLESEERKAREAKEEKERKRRADRVFDMMGGGDECANFGIMDGCKPHCPMFARGDCPIQEENVANFAERGME